MQMFVVGADRASKGSQDWLEFYARRETGDCYGPLRLLLGTLYISKSHFAYPEAKERLETLRKTFGKKNCHTKPYGQVGYVIWLYSSDTDKDPNILEGYKGAFQSVSFSDRVYNRLNFPDHSINFSLSFMEILDAQKALHRKLWHVRDDFILPMQYAGMSLEDSLRWFHSVAKKREALTSRIRANADERKASIARVPDIIFFRSTTAAKEGIEATADELEQKLKEINPRHSLDRCWNDAKSDNPYRTIINLYSMERIGNGFARLFG